jgi:PDZ domain
MEDHLLKVIAPIDNTPAAKAGIMANDIITKLDHEPVHGLTLDQAIEKMRGPVHTKVKLTIMRKGQNKPVDVTIVRDLIRVKSVRSHNEGSAGRPVTGEMSVSGPHRRSGSFSAPDSMNRRAGSPSEVDAEARTSAEMTSSSQLPRFAIIRREHRI